jgi:hypothetical protein
LHTLFAIDTIIVALLFPRLLSWLQRVSRGVKNTFGISVHSTFLEVTVLWRMHVVHVSLIWKNKGRLIKSPFCLSVHVSPLISLNRLVDGSPILHVFSPEGGVGQTQAWMPTYVSTLRIPQMIWVWRAMVEWYWQGKTEELGEKPVPVPLRPPQIPHGLTRVSAVRGRRLTTWAMARPSGNRFHAHTAFTFVQATYLRFKLFSFIPVLHIKDRGMGCECSGVGWRGEHSDPSIRYQENGRKNMKRFKNCTLLKML